ncbi:MAG: hypothetical protein MZV63_15100 [Marinilabiliales bacterium]|nr:hypothetical protein [Marinilabiliales bacterium]
MANAGRSMPARMAMMAMTTSSSINVNPFRRVPLRRGRPVSRVNNMARAFQVGVSITGRTITVVSAAVNWCVRIICGSGASPGCRGSEGAGRSGCDDCFRSATRYCPSHGPTTPTGRTRTPTTHSGTHHAPGRRSQRRSGRRHHRDRAETAAGRRAPRRRAGDPDGGA